jgi:hypothetical protein
MIKDIKYYVVLCDDCKGVIKEVKSYDVIIKTPSERVLCPYCTVKEQFDGDVFDVNTGNCFINQ